MTLIEQYALPRHRYTICVDFDGVLMRYDTAWAAPHIIPDQPVTGAMAWLTSMREEFDVVIFSTRARTWRGRRAIRKWLNQHRPEKDAFHFIVTDRKYPALVYLDDRAMRFDGTHFPTADQIHRALPWHRNKSAPRGFTGS